MEPTETRDRAEQEAREQRARERASWPVKVFPLGEEPPQDLPEGTTPEERLAMVWRITVDTWRLSGREIPDYPRHETPLRLILPGQPPRTYP